MPDHTTNPVRQFRLLQTPQQPAVDGGHVRRVGLIALVLVNPCSTLRSIDDADGNLMLFNEHLAQLNAPIAYLKMMMVLAAVKRQGVAPDSVPGPVLIRARCTKAAQPGASVGMNDSLVGPGFGIGLALNNKHVPTDQITGLVQNRLSLALLDAELRAIGGQSRLQFYR